MLLFNLPENQILFPMDYLKISPVKTGEASIYVYNRIPHFSFILKMSNKFPYGTVAEIQFIERNIKIFKC